MSDEEHSESEFYYPEDENEGYETVFRQFNEVQSNYALYEERNSQEEIDSFIKEQKSLNTVKKTASNMNAFNRYLAEISKQYLNIRCTYQHRNLTACCSNFSKISVS